MARGLVAVVVVLTIMSGTAEAQQRDGCSAPERPSVGGAIGRSSPYLELGRDEVPNAGSQSILVRGGMHLSARGDVSLAGPIRARLEASASRWHVTGQTYDAANNYQVQARTDLGSIAVRQIGAAVGLRGGRRPLCAYGLGGAGLHSLSFAGSRSLSLGVWIIAGVEARAGDHGLIHVEVQLHMIDTAGRRPTAGVSGVPTAMLMAGWSYRF